MQWGEGGSLDDLILSRQGIVPPAAQAAAAAARKQLNPDHVESATQDSASPSQAPSGEFLTKEEKIRAFKKRRKAKDEETVLSQEAGAEVGDKETRAKARESNRKAREMKAIHLFNAEEIKSLFGDIACGLAFLVMSTICLLSTTHFNDSGSGCSS